MLPAEVRAFVEGIRVRGVRWAARALLQRFVFSQRRMYIVWDPPMTTEAPPPDPSFTFRLAGLDDLEDLRVFEPYVVQARFREWLERSDTWVILAFDGARPVAFRTEGTRPPQDPGLPPIVLEPHQVWTVELYVLPEYRRRQVSMQLRAHADRALMARGFTEKVSKLDAGNYPQLKRKMTTLPRPRRIHHVRSLCVLGLRWRWVDPDGWRALEREVSQLEGVGHRGTAAREGSTSPE